MFWSNKIIPLLIEGIVLKTKTLYTLQSIDNSLKVLSKCVQKNPNTHGDSQAFTTKHWNGWQ